MDICIAPCWDDSPVAPHIRVSWSLYKELGRAGNMQDAKYFYCAEINGAVYRTQQAKQMAKRLGVDPLRTQGRVPGKAADARGMQDMAHGRIMKIMLALFQYLL